MRFTQHPSNNRVLGAPKGWDQGALNCGALPVTDTVVEGLPAIVSFWKPDPEELQALLAGESVALYVIGQSMPPVMVAVTAKT